MDAVDVLPRESWQVPASTLTPPERAGILLGLIDTYGWDLEFVDTPTDAVTRVHVLGPDDDQPRYPTAAENLVVNRLRMVCGQIIYIPRMRGVGIATPFPDEHLCKRCYRAFQAHGVEAPSVIFEHNTAAGPRTGLWAMEHNDAIRALWRHDEDRAEARQAAGNG